MSEELLTPQEVADILKIKKTTVYEMVKKGTIPAVRMGKQLRFASSDLKRYIGAKSDDAPVSERTSAMASSHEAPSGSAQRENAPRETRAGTPAGIVVCGQDNVLDMLCSTTNAIVGGDRFLRSYMGSYDGLVALYRNEVQIASAHLWDMETDTYNLPFVRALVPGEDVCVIHVLRRKICIYTAKGNPLAIRTIADFKRAGIAMVNREKGSGIRVLTDSLFCREGISGERIQGYGRIVNSHLAAASIISRGGADVAVGTASAAALFPNVGTVDLREEEYDLVVRREDLLDRSIARFIEVLRSPSFREEVAALGGYDVTGMGEEKTNGFLRS